MIYRVFLQLGQYHFITIKTLSYYNHTDLFFELNFLDISLLLWVLIDSLAMRGEQSRSTGTTEMLVVIQLVIDCSLTCRNTSLFFFFMLKIELKFIKKLLFLLKK